MNKEKERSTVQRLVPGTLTFERLGEFFIFKLYVIRVLSFLPEVEKLLSSRDRERKVC